MTWQLYQGDALEILKQLESESVHCCVSSPPYWGLRDYGVDGQLGLESTPEEYVFKMVEVFREVKRVLRKDGTCWINLGDSYSSGGIISNFTDCFNRVMEGGPVVIGHTATIGITAEGVDVSLDNKGFPYGELLSLFGIERVIVKQRDNDFCQVLYTLTDPCYCWIGVPALSVSRNMADLEIIFDSGYDISIIITEHNPDGEPKLKIPVVGGTGAGINSNRAFAIEEPCKPITETIRNGETIGDAISFNAPLKSLPNIYFIDKTVSLGDGFNLCAGDVGNFSITKATLEQFNFLIPDSGFNVAVHGVSHFYTSNMYGSFIHYNQLYHKAEQLSNEMQSKQELGVPEMVKRALMRDGWICRSTIIWAKSNPMPESVTDRPTKSHEYIFLLAKSERYYYDHEAIKEPSTYLQPNSPESIKSPYGQGYTRRASTGVGFGHGTDKEKRARDRVRGSKGVINNPLNSDLRKSGNKERKIDTSGRLNTHMGSSVPWKGLTRNKRTVWTVPTKPFSEAHFATFPPELIFPCILAGCPEGGTALDPFAGAGTTLYVSEQLERNSIGIEINSDYCEIIRHRMSSIEPSLFQLQI